jgi:hypothetical protein
MDKYTTYTIVVETSSDTVENFLGMAPDGVQFWASENGISQKAMEEGAEPSSWDADLDD